MIVFLSNNNQDGVEEYPNVKAIDIRVNSYSINIRENGILILDKNRKTIIDQKFKIISKKKKEKNSCN